MYQPIRNSVELGSHDVHFDSFLPPKDLRQQVTSFWEYSTDQRSAPIQVFPSGCCSLGLSVCGDELYGYFYGPITDASILGEFVEGVLYFGAAFHPGAELLFQAFSLAEIKGTCIDVGNVWGREIGPLINDQLLYSHTARYSLLTSLLRRVLMPPTNSFAEGHSVITDFLKQPNASIHEMAYAAKINERRFRRYFENNVGLSPKKLETVVRTQNALSKLVATDLPLDRIACEVGFADQAHLTRRLSAALGDSPMQLRRKIRSNQTPSTHKTVPWHLFGDPVEPYRK